MLKYDRSEAVVSSDPSVEIITDLCDAVNCGSHLHDSCYPFQWRLAAFSVTFDSVNLFICNEYLLMSPQKRQETPEHQMLRNRHSWNFPKHNVKNSADLRTCLCGIPKEIPKHSNRNEL